MDIVSFEATLASVAPPPGLTAPLEALWWAGRGEWDRAHAIAQDIRSADGAWVHAYLHRQEGDEGNARYWYQQAGRPQCRLSLPEEWRGIAAALLTSPARS